MKNNKLISFLLIFVMILSTIFGNSIPGFSEGYEDEIALITFIDSNKFGTHSIDDEGSHYKEVEISINFMKPGLINLGDRVKIELPDASNYIARVDMAEVDINGVHTVRGYIEDKPHSYFLISSKNNKSVGMISLIEDEKIYSINYNNNMRTHCFYEEIKDIEMQPSEPLIPPMVDFEDLAEGVHLEPLSQKDLNEEVTIDLMLVYTPSAMAHAEKIGGIDNVIAQAMGNSQLVLDNSKVNINLRLVHSRMVEYQEEGNNSALDLERLTDREDGYMDEVHEWRDLYGADLVGLIADVRDVGGIGWLLNREHGSPSYGFTVNSINYLHLTYTLIHEIGHNMGCHHSRNQMTYPADDRALFPYSTGWRWNGLSGQSYASVMTYHERSIGVPIFSNPDILWDGVPTGSYEGRYAPADNARSLKEIKHVVADYRNKKVVNIPIESIELSESKLYLLEGMTEKLNATVIPYGSRDNRIWSSKDKSIATVDQQGNVTGVSKGSTIISLSDKRGTVSASCQITIDDDGEICFPDINLENQIRNSINIPSEPILKSDVFEIERLYLHDNEISNMEGLQYFKNLSQLYLQHCQIEDIAPLSGLNKLTSLYLSYNNIKDIDALSELTKLEHLDLSGNSISDIEPLSDLQKIYSLSLSDNEIVDISPLVRNINYSSDYYGRYIYIRSNYLDITEGSASMMVIDQLIGEGISVYYVPQKKYIGVSEISLNKSYLELEVGQYGNLEETIIPEDAVNKDIIWKSSDPDVAKVDDNGDVLAISPGIATITVTSKDGYKETTCKVKVVKGNEIWEDILTTKSANHTWTVRLSVGIDENTVNSSNVYIVDKYFNKLSFITAEVRNDEEFGYLILNNNGEFELNKDYWIIIEDSIRSILDTKLGKGLKIRFNYNQ